MHNIYKPCSASNILSDRGDENVEKGGFILNRK